MNDSDEVQIRFWRTLFNLSDNLRDTAASLVGNSDDWNLTIQQMRLLRVVYKRTTTTSPDGIMLKTIAETLNVTSAAVCGMVENMVRRGLLTRSRSSTNRRSVNITLSDYSKEKIGEMENFFSSLSEELRQILGKDQFQSLTDTLELLSTQFAEKHPDNFHSFMKNS